MDNYFIDCGSHNSCSSRIFRKIFDPRCEYHIYSFEIEPSFLKYYDNLKNHTLINKAVWIENGFKTFHLDTEQRKAGGSLIKKTNKNRHKESIEVETIDFPQWLLDTFNKDDIITLKIDIEGAEYSVIPRMIELECFKKLNISKLHLEWHWYKVGMTEEEHNKVANMIKHINQYSWPGIEQAQKILGKNYLQNL